MKKGIVIWILILAALIGTAVLTMPNVPPKTHRHQFAASKDCTVFTCKLCGHRKSYKVAQHDYQRSDCHTATCTGCGRTRALPEPQHVYEQTRCLYLTCIHCGVEGTNTTHLGWCSSFDVCPTCGDSVPQGSKEYHDYQSKETDLLCTKEQACTICGKVSSTSHSGYWEFSADAFCKQIRTCGVCGMTEGNWGELHLWTSDNCENGTVCSVCDKSGPSTHNFENGFLRVFDRCTQCDLPLYMTSDFNLPVLLAEIFGVLLTAFAFEYAIRRRKYMKIHWWLILRAWLNDTTFASDFRPAVLLKKEAR